MKYILFSFVISTAALLPAAAQELEYKPGTEEWKMLYDPPFETVQKIKPGNALRKELFNILRPKLEAEAGEPILFTGDIEVFRNWALFQGASLDKKGEPIAYPEMGNSDTVALWLRTREGWKLVDYSGGHSDVFYIVWPEMYGMPKEIL
ncbi:MAG: hypothetical protein P1U58_08050 [Verrucomicrobiales bacterium]|nr:hypothetical protein [Verrucomicrobiales bacterium]